MRTGLRMVIFVDGVMNHLDPQVKVFPGSSALDFFT
jgi:hypothetical protein